MRVEVVISSVNTKFYMVDSMTVFFNVSILVLKFLIPDVVIVRSM